MKNSQYLLNILLTAVLFAALCVALILRVLMPAVIIPPLNIPNMVFLSVIALLLEHFIAGDNPRCYICVFVFSAASFALLPLVAGFACQHDFWKYGLVGGVVFTVVTFFFTSAVQRLRTGPKARAAVVITAFGICLAAQCFAGILL